MVTVSHLPDMANAGVMARLLVFSVLPSSFLPLSRGWRLASLDLDFFLFFFPL